MKTPLKESFNRELCLRAFALQLSIILSDVNEYLQCMTFKNTEDASPRPNSDATQQLLTVKDFSGETTDPFLQYVLNVRFVLTDWQEKLKFMPENPDRVDAAFDLEVYNLSLRYQEYHLHYKQSKSDDNLKLHFERAVASYIHVIYRYACMLCLKSYILPPGYERQFLHGGRDYIWLMDVNDAQVAPLIALMKELEIQYYKITKHIGDKNTILTFTFPSYRKSLKKQ